MRVEVSHLNAEQLARLASIEERAAEPVFDYHDEFYRRMFARSGREYPDGTRWAMQLETTPSGKALFRCRQCFRFSVAPDKTCPDGCHIGEDE